MPEDPSTVKVKKYAKYAALVGMLLAIACQKVPPEYQAACNLMANIVPHSCS